MFCKTLVMATALFALLAAAPPDPILGTWKLNLSKSKFNPGPAPRSQTRTYVQTPDGVQVTIQTIGANGRAAKPIEFPDRYDGKDYPMKGSEIADALALVRINDYMAEATMKHAGKTVAVARRLITDEGRTLVISYEEPNSEPPVNNELVCDKQ
ncbi:MAG: hypothetical protein ABSG41_20150 [Bryobacteraceae bacterium]|jgi:hypothetical protein